MPPLPNLGGSKKAKKNLFGDESESENENDKDEILIQPKKQVKNTKKASNPLAGLPSLGDPLGGAKKSKKKESSNPLGNPSKLKSNPLGATTKPKRKIGKQKNDDLDINIV